MLDCSSSGNDYSSGVFENLQTTNLIFSDVCKVAIFIIRTWHHKWTNLVASLGLMFPWSFPMHISTSHYFVYLIIPNSQDFCFCYWQSSNYNSCQLKLWLIGPNRRHSVLCSFSFYIINKSRQNKNLSTKDCKRTRLITDIYLELVLMLPTIRMVTNPRRVEDLFRMK